MRIEDEHPLGPAAVPAKQRRRALLVMRLGLAVAVLVTLFVGIGACERIDAGIDGDDYELHFNGFLLGKRDLECRVHKTDPYIPAEGEYAIAKIPRAQIPGLESVPIEIRFRDVLGLPHHGYVTFDVRETRSSAYGLYMWEGQSWAVFKAPEKPGDPAVITFDQPSDACVTVRYGIDTDGKDVPQVLPIGQRTITVPTLPRSVAVRFDFCDGKKVFEKLGPDGAAIVPKSNF